MTIRLLRTLVAVADTKTFSAAASVVHVTHAAVSQQMRTLEADLGITLFDRSKRTPVLTPVAMEVVRKARVLIDDYDNLVPSVLSDDGLSGEITFGALPTTLTGLTPQMMVVLKAKFPEINMRIRPGLTAPLLSDIERGTIDAAVLTKPHSLPIGIAFRELVHEPLQLIASTQEPGDDPVELLTKRPFIRFNRNAVVGTLIDNWILAKRVSVTETMELDSLEAIASMVHANLGVSIVPKRAVQPQDNISLKRLSLGPDAPTRCLGLAFREDHVKTRVIDELFAALRQVIDAAATAKRMA